jgi:hypothetical protein
VNDVPWTVALVVATWLLLPSKAVMVIDALPEMPAAASSRLTWFIAGSNSIHWFMRHTSTPQTVSATCAPLDGGGGPGVSTVSGCSWSAPKGACPNVTSCEENSVVSEVPVARPAKSIVLSAASTAAGPSSAAAVATATTTPSLRRSPTGNQKRRNPPLATSPFRLAPGNDARCEHGRVR